MSQSNNRIKAKVLANLDKICLDPQGFFANAELLKNDESVLLYNKGICGSNQPKWKEWKSKGYQVEIEGEVIDLNPLMQNKESRNAVVNALVNEIGQNKNDWEIVEPIPGSDTEQMAQHKQSGRRHWKSYGHLDEWKKIEALINDLPLPNDNPSNAPNLKKELAKLLLQYFQEKNIKLVSLDNNQLVITYADGQLDKNPDDSQELQKINDWLRKSNKYELSRQALSSIVSANTNSEPKSNMPLLIGGGITVAVLVGLVIGLVISRNKQKSAQAW